MTAYCCPLVHPTSQCTNTFDPPMTFWSKSGIDGIHSRGLPYIFSTHLPYSHILFIENEPKPPSRACRARTLHSSDAEMARSCFSSDIGKFQSSCIESTDNRQRCVFCAAESIWAAGEEIGEGTRRRSTTPTTARAPLLSIWIR